MTRKIEIVLAVTVDHSLDQPVVCISSPSIPGLHVMGTTLAAAMRAAGPVAERLIELNNMKALKSLLLSGDSNG